MIPLDSSNLNGYEYDEQSRVLVIEFHGGRAYSYFDVPPGVARALGSASSAGKYFHAAIKDQYEFKRGTWRGGSPQAEYARKGLIDMLKDLGI